jgi:hypothetical protein
LKLVIRSCCVCTLIIELRQRRALKTYKNFSAGYAVKYRVPTRKGQLVYERLSKVRGYFPVFCSNMSLNQNKESAQTLRRIPTKKLGLATPLFKNLLKNLRGASILDDTKCLVNKSGPVKINHMRKLSQLDKNISRINEMMTMFNRKRISLCKLEHERADISSGSLSLIKKKLKRKRRKPERHRGLVRHVGTGYETRVKS